jgi:hypothetical protein
MFATSQTTRVTSRRRPAAVTSTRPSTLRRVTNGKMPEWMTERWKHRVEAEARLRLRRNVHDVGGVRHDVGGVRRDVRGVR